MSKLFYSNLLDHTKEAYTNIALTLQVGDIRQFRNREINPVLSRLTAEENGRLLVRKQKNAALMRYVEEEMSAIKCMVTIPPHLFLLTDEEGVTIYLQYPEYMEAALREIGLKEGVSFSFDQLGVNGISMAMERQTIVTVRGPEHDIKLFSDWNCLCIPIRAEGQAVGYLDLSFHHSIDIEFAAVLLCQLAGNIEKRLLKDSPHRKVELVFEAFDRFGLSAREKEAAYGWLLNHSVLRISSEMGITEGTARNLIKKVYRKTKVNDKGQFIKAFGGLVN